MTMFFQIFAFVLCLAVGGAMPADARERSVQEIEERKKSDLARKKAREERRKKQGKDRSARAVAVKETIAVAVLRREKIVPPALSNLDPILQDEALFGAQIGIEDNNTTGAFTGQVFTMKDVLVPHDGDIARAFNALSDEGYRYFITDVDADDLLAMADLKAAGTALIFNTRARDDILRNQQCRANIFHIGPSRAMLSDALIQYLIHKRWKKWLLIRGQEDPSGLFAAALKRSAKKFGGTIVGEKTWTFTHDARRTARSEVPLLTKGIDYDIVLSADEKGEFGEHLIWNTWDPRLVAGSQGLVPNAWHRTHEQWGAAQMQNRFRRHAGRWMSMVDYAAWTAIRSIGEAALRLGNGQDPQAIRTYLRSDAFEIAAYKGVKLSFRPWNQQMRQRILLSSPRALVSFSPQIEFLHPHTPLDTLGFDAKETSCSLGKE